MVTLPKGVDLDLNMPDLSFIKRWLGRLKPKEKAPRQRMANLLAIYEGHHYIRHELPLSEVQSLRSSRYEWRRPGKRWIGWFVGTIVGMPLLFILMIFTPGMFIETSIRTAGIATLVFAPFFGGTVGFMYGLFFLERYVFHVAWITGAAEKADKETGEVTTEPGYATPIVITSEMEKRSKATSETLTESLSFPEVEAMVKEGRNKRTPFQIATLVTASMAIGVMMLFGVLVTQDEKGPQLLTDPQGQEYYYDGLGNKVFTGKIIVPLDVPIDTTGGE